MVEVRSKSSGGCLSVLVNAEFLVSVYSCILGLLKKATSDQDPLGTLYILTRKGDVGIKEIYPSRRFTVLRDSHCYIHNYCYLDLTVRVVPERSFVKLVSNELRKRLLDYSLASCHLATLTYKDELHRTGISLTNVGNCICKTCTSGAHDCDVFRRYSQNYLMCFESAENVDKGSALICEQDSFLGLVTDTVTIDGSNYYVSVVFLEHLEFSKRVYSAAISQKFPTAYVFKFYFLWNIITSVSL
ncbi:uncharacterized protein LOC112126234 [Cimex lectularius]|uniref:Uncharacterized protein n=1 Tax=Cimex lectularius TaxID=79782 RepID=A0A8I6SRM3_CIMLE|nr:uncharacterized protein LOC112126234 [Cimex lectularius]